MIREHERFRIVVEKSGPIVEIHFSKWPLRDRLLAALSLLKGTDLSLENPFIERKISKSEEISGLTQIKF